MNVRDPRYVILFTAGLTCAFTAAVMTVQVATADKISRNEALRYQRALVEVFGLGDVEQMSDEQIAEVVGRQIQSDQTVRDPRTGREFTVVRAYRSSGRDEVEVLGLEFEISGTGFWAPIEGLMALKADLSEVMGVVFLDQKETPGLGGRIMEQTFRDQFKGLKARGPVGGEKLIYISKDRPTSPADPRYGRTVEAITGATQTSMAVEKFVNANLQQFLRALQAEESPMQN